MAKIVDSRNGKTGSRSLYVLIRPASTPDRGGRPFAEGAERRGNARSTACKPPDLRRMSAQLATIRGHRANQEAGRRPCERTSDPDFIKVRVRHYAVSFRAGGGPWTCQRAAFEGRATGSFDVGCICARCSPSRWHGNARNGRVPRVALPVSVQLLPQRAPGGRFGPDERYGWAARARQSCAAASSWRSPKGRAGRETRLRQPQRRTRHTALDKAQRKRAFAPRHPTPPRRYTHRGYPARGRGRPAR